MNIRASLSQLLKSFQPLNKEVPQAYRSYYKSRDISEVKYLCHAPFNNMYFNSLGNVANCWLTFDNPEIYDGTRTVKEIWFGEKFTRLRQAIREYDLNYRCKTCRHYLEVGNYVNVLAKAYDNEFPLGEYPTMMEFELSNTCNLECTMCNGFLSSVIRSNRENLPALKSPYGDEFVEQLREFIPHLKEARFNGGEPFLIHIYYKIWDLIRELNPECNIVVATNGTTLTPRVKEYLERGNFHINISVDSLDPDLYAGIRINSDLKSVLENVQYFKQYCYERKRTICIMVNPMRQNWHGLADFVNYCNEQHLHLWYNSVIRPYNQAIWNLPAEELKIVYETLSKIKLNENKNTPSGMYKYNIGIYDNLVNTQIKTWYEEAVAREARTRALLPAHEGQTAIELFGGDMEIFLKEQFREDVSEAEAARKILLEKLALVDTHLAGRIPVSLYYNSLDTISPSSVFIFLLENEPEKIKTFLDYSILQIQ